LQALELGGSIIWEKNYLLFNLAKEFDLPLRWLSPPINASLAKHDCVENDNEGDTFAIWNGKHFVIAKVCGERDAMRIRILSPYG
jgi:hypothetical protein